LWCSVPKHLSQNKNFRGSDFSFFLSYSIWERVQMLLTLPYHASYFPSVDSFLLFHLFFIEAKVAPNLSEPHFPFPFAKRPYTCANAAQTQVFLSHFEPVNYNQKFLSYPTRRILAPLQLPGNKMKQQTRLSPWHRRFTACPLFFFPSPRPWFIFLTPVVA